MEKVGVYIILEILSTIQKPHCIHCYHQFMCVCLSCFTSCVLLLSADYFTHTIPISQTWPESPNGNTCTTREYRAHVTRRLLNLLDGTPCEFSTFYDLQTCTLLNSQCFALCRNRDTHGPALLSMSVRL